MVLVPASEDLGIDTPFCIDTYEASRQDATETSQGVDASRACSRPGVLPWSVNPMSSDALAVFKAACEASGKRLCSAAEWTTACTGCNDTTYAYGDTFDPLICNCPDTFCSEYCQEENISDCNTDTNCGFGYDCYDMVPTGSLPACISAQGAFDVNGNVWEVVTSQTDDRGYEIRGGAFNSGGAADKHRCSFKATWDTLYAGFRCCKDAY
jgi:formylglycine-generating enzyme required for sulfatase activity